MGEAAVSGANEVSGKAVEGLETVVGSTGLINPVCVNLVVNVILVIH